MSTAATTTAIHAAALSKSFGARAAVAGIELSLDAGDCLALFGPNGAGKTTLLRLIAGLLKPTSGAVRVRGVDVRSEPEARARVGLISHHSMLYAPLTARENVEFSARLYGLGDPRGAAARALATMKLGEHADVPLRTLSRGLTQRASIARAIVHEPTVMLLDEPYNGLDESGAAALTDMLRGVRDRGATLILVTHNVAEGLALATHAGIMTGGRFARFERRTAAGFDAPTYASEYRALVGSGGGGAHG